MARNGSGTYARTQSDYTFNTVIQETQINSELNDIATELTNSIDRDGQTPISGILQHSVTVGQTANTGSVQGNNAITTEFYEIATCANPGDAVTLPAAVAGQLVIIVNNGAQSADVFPASGDKIDGGSVNAAFALASGANALFICQDGTDWDSLGGGFFTPSSTTTLTNKTFDANGTGNSLSNVDVADLAAGTDGQLITWGADAAATTVAAGTSGHFLKSQGAGSVPVFSAIPTVNIVDDTSPQLGGFLDANGNYIQMQKGGDISSASPTVIDTDGDFFICTGTNSFSALTVAADRHFFLEFAAVLTMTHGAGTLDLPGGANITTAAGDVGEFVSTASNVVTCVNYSKASGKPIVTNFATSDIAANAIDETLIKDAFVADFTDATVTASDYFLHGDATDSGNTKKDTVQGILDLVTVSGLDATPASDHTANGPQTSTLSSGYSSAIMDLVYLNANGKWLEADADATGTSINLLGMALEAKTDGQAMNVALAGSFVRDDTFNWTIGVPLYISNTLGAITETKPSGSGDIVRTVAYSVTADVIFFNPSSDYVTLA